jgi:predicted RNA binding protein YcfA (HicA-like mRNA interferase family)
MGIKKNVIEILSLPTEMKYLSVKNIFEFFGYKLLKFKGSHAYFVNEEIDDDKKKIFMFPTVNGRNVKKWYLKEIVRFLDLVEWNESE